MARYVIYKETLIDFKDHFWTFVGSFLGIALIGFINKESLKKQYDASKGGIGYFFIDDVLPEDVALDIYKAFPKPEQMVLKKSSFVQ